MEGKRPKSWCTWCWIAALVVIIGLGIAAHVDLGMGKQVVGDAQTGDELSLRLQALVERIGEVEGRVVTLRDLVNAYQRAVAETSDALEHEKAAVRKLALVEGAMAAKGKGVRIKVEDPDEAVGAYEVLLIINELRSAGAQAVVLNGHRFDGHSFVSRDTVGLSLNGIRIRPPFVIEAVGDPQGLISALTVPGGLFSVLSRAGGLSLTVERAASISVPPRPGGPRVFELAEKEQ